MAATRGKQGDITYVGFGGLPSDVYRALKLCCFDGRGSFGLPVKTWLFPSTLLHRFHSGLQETDEESSRNDLNKKQEPGWTKIIAT
eukprot:5690174-Amphidinium_carterae.1